MNKLLSILLTSALLSFNTFAQVPALDLPCLTEQNKHRTNNNGQIDLLEEFSALCTVPFTMPDGIDLMTDIFVPMTMDCMMVELDLGALIPGAGTIDIEFIPKYTQLFYYDMLNGQPNPNPWQLPIVMTRTPYDKEGDVTGSIVSLMGYNYAMQDMRGRYSSGGVYMPMYSDSWDKNPYHSDFKHVLDPYDTSDIHNGNRHEDGYNSVEFIKNNLTRKFDLDGDGGLETTDLAYNGSIGTFGASALGNTQYQLAAAHQIDPNGPGLKCLLPIVATLEHYRYTGYQNGVFRDRIVTGWIKGQIFTGTDDDLINIDESWENNIHTAYDYNMNNKFDAANAAIDHFVTEQYNNEPCGYYPNSRGRADMDGTAAPINANGEGDANGNVSRYSLMEVPAYHLTGWWDIFTDGTIETYNQMMTNLSDLYGNKQLQKIIIGPWAHQTIGSRETGDQCWDDPDDESRDDNECPYESTRDYRYPANVTSILGFDLGNLDENDINAADVVNSEVISWFRHNLNYNSYANIGEPKVRIPKSDNWQHLVVIAGILETDINVPSEDFNIEFNELLNYLNGSGGLNGLQIAYINPTNGDTTTSTIDIPASGSPLIGELADGQQQINPIQYVDYTQVPNVRFYVVGPVSDLVNGNANLGNYWYQTDQFPIPNVRRAKLFMHADGSMNWSPPHQDEGYQIYVHDPDDPILTVGGANMIVSSPQGDRDSQGQMDLALPGNAPFTMNRPGVISFEKEINADSLCIIGFPRVQLFAKSNPGGVPDGDPTDTDFFVRVLDVYPDGRELFVVEGCINARARKYVRHMAVNNLEEDPSIPYENIEVGKIYEYLFYTMPIAYTWGKSHKIKILISSSNYTRYQVNPNLPMEEGQFFRRKPGDGRKYTYDGVEMEPRVAVQRVHFSPQHPTHIDLPLYEKNYNGVEETASANNSLNLEAVVYPNPTDGQFNIFMNKPGKYDAVIVDMQGRYIDIVPEFVDHLSVDASQYQKGIYLVEITSAKGEVLVERISVE